MNGLLDVDYPNQPEMREVFDVSSCVAAGLRSDGYRVLLTKAHESSSVSLTERARIADRAHAALAISVHDDHSQGPTFQAVYSQLGLTVDGRHHAMWRGRGSHRTVFDQPSVARASDRAARLIARARSRAEGRPVRLAEENFAGRPPLEPGNLALVQLLTHRPWVYNELGARAGGSTTSELTVAQETAYAQGLLDGAEAAVPNGDRSPATRASLGRCLAARR